ncbi:MAG: DUF2791 family P-loop domain-containing protein [Caldilineaceae bacterium]|nr:DUF2791 family P-loop domain-containing protein [Caldilineaceae bacterium]MBP8108873.1 DUF2791 family P-loop domain-containing protein [Caldilineaceae bacterium]MBP8124817.1 DUF2791 family P-loop domain-containing protein [Caldilineaceae bacterium]MBP9074452.1 DUF2791 family P-loop domain-containing protein [Caldilineaceae bacterium]
MTEQPSQPTTQIGDPVEHPQYGRGRVTALFRNGAEWMVQFESGLRFRRPRAEFAGQESVTLAPASPMPMPDTLPMSRTQFEARQLVEALRVGVAPAQHIQELTIGLVEERATLSAGIVQAHQTGGGALAVLGDYGYGKSHIVELTAQDALDRGFLVAAASLDLLELPAHRAFDVYAALMRNLRFPDGDERGLGVLMEKARGNRRLHDELRELSGVDDDPLAVALYALDNTSSSRQRRAWENWIGGGRKVKSMNKAAPKKVRFPSIYRVGHNARQIAFLLSGVSVLARLAGYSGLCILIDEAESYSLLAKYQQPKATQFFSAVIYAAQQDRQSRITPDAFPQHRWREYPLAYTDRQSLFFLFTVTRSDNRMPLESWLAKEQIIDLAPKHTPQEIGQFLQQVMTYHGQAYGYEPGERQGQIRRGAAEHLALGMRNDKLSIRGIVRLAVELYDLLYLHPEYDTATLLDELREQMR